jgi:hypothetical protein
MAEQAATQASQRRLCRRESRRTTTISITMPSPSGAFVE